MRSFRCFGQLECEPGPGLNFITGANAQGKTSILEAACLLLRLRSPRTTALSEIIRFGEPTFALEGLLDETRLSMTCTPPLRTLKLDGVAQSSSTDYLTKGRIVWFGNGDMALVDGSAERRRKFLDSTGLQIGGSYGSDLKAYDRALRSRNLLLREGRPRREVEAYDLPLAETGERIIAARDMLVTDLKPLAVAACRTISGENLELCYAPGSGIPMLETLISSRDEEMRLRQTRVGPQRDDLVIRINGHDAGAFASEGQRRTIALALKMAMAALLTEKNATPPLLLLDDVFGELDASRRTALLEGMPGGSQALLSTAELSGISPPAGSRVFRLEKGILTG